VNLVKSGFRHLGVDIRRYDPLTAHEHRRARLLADHAVDLAIDGGANVGEYAERLRLAGYRGRILSVEPGSEAFSLLKSRCAHDPLWDAIQVALSDHEGTGVLFVAGNSLSSSLLPMNQRHLEAAPGSGYVGSEQVSIRTLDGVIENVGGFDRSVFVKLDVQGAEGPILRGSTRALRTAVRVLEVELSLVALYEGQQLFKQMLELLEPFDFRLVGLEPAFVEAETGHVLQVDGLFWKAPRCGESRKDDRAR